MLAGRNRGATQAPDEDSPRATVIDDEASCVPSAAIARCRARTDDGVRPRAR
jgi:hypothetical protein